MDSLEEPSNGGFAINVNNNGCPLRSVEEIPLPYRNIFPFSHFNNVQSEVMDVMLYLEDSVVVSSPTGSGKTVLFEMAIINLLMTLRHTQNDFKVVYVAPMKAICSERLISWSQKFSTLDMPCVSITGDSELVDLRSLENSRIIITTPEKWHSITRNWQEKPTVFACVKLFLIDEIHLLNDPERGPILEALVSRMKRIHTKLNIVENQTTQSEQYLRFVAVSATLPNIEDFGVWLDAKYFTFNEDYRPIKVEKFVLGYPCQRDWSPYKFDISLNYKLKQIIETYSNNKPTLIFCTTRKSVEQTAKVLASVLVFKFTGTQMEDIQNVAAQLSDVKLKQMVLKGIGWHHAGITLNDKLIVEHLFKHGILPVLMTTGTLAMGVNLPAHLVIIKSTDLYVSNGYERYDEIALMQMIGRAGRPQYDNRGVAVVMARNSEKAYFERLLTSHSLIESNLKRHLNAILNAEIVAKTILNVNDAVEWFRLTFFYVRIFKNPAHYGYDSRLTRDEIENKFKGYCQWQINNLVKCQLISIDANEMTPTLKGTLMCKYYLSFETMTQLFKVTGNDSMRKLLTLISECHEFNDVKIRVNDKKILNALNVTKSGESIRFTIPGRVQTNSMKTFCLIQAVLGAIPIFDSSLKQDALKVMRIAERVSNCLRDYVLNTPNHFVTTKNIITLTKCIQLQMWEDSIYVSRQIEQIGPALSRRFARENQRTIHDLRALNPRQIEIICQRRAPFGNKIAAFIQKIPDYALNVALSGEKVAVRVELNNWRVVKESGASGSCYLIVGDTTNNVLLSDKVLDRDLTKTGFVVRMVELKMTGQCEVYVHLISVEWVGVDVQKTLSIAKDVNVYAKFSTKAREITSKQLNPNQTQPNSIPTATIDIHNRMNNVDNYDIESIKSNPTQTDCVPNFDDMWTDDDIDQLFNQTQVSSGSGESEGRNSQRETKKRGKLTKNDRKSSLINNETRGSVWKQTALNDFYRQSRSPKRVELRPGKRDKNGKLDSRVVEEWSEDLTNYSTNVGDYSTNITNFSTNQSRGNGPERFKSTRECAKIENQLTNGNRSAIGGSNNDESNRTFQTSFEQWRKEPNVTSYSTNQTLRNELEMPGNPGRSEQTNRSCLNREENSSTNQNRSSLSTQKQSLDREMTRLGSIISNFSHEWGKEPNVTSYSTNQTLRNELGMPENPGRFEPTNGSSLNHEGNLSANENRLSLATQKQSLDPGMARLGSIISNLSHEWGKEPNVTSYSTYQTLRNELGMPGNPGGSEQTNRSCLNHEGNLWANENRLSLATQKQSLDPEMARFGSTISNLSYEWGKEPNVTSYSTNQTLRNELGVPGNSGRFEPTNGSSLNHEGNLSANENRLNLANQKQSSTCEILSFPNFRLISNPKNETLNSNNVEPSTNSQHYRFETTTRTDNYSQPNQTTPNQSLNSVNTKNVNELPNENRGMYEHVSNFRTNRLISNVKNIISNNVKPLANIQNIPCDNNERNAPTTRSLTCEQTAKKSNKENINRTTPKKLGVQMKIVGNSTRISPFKTPLLTSNLDTPIFPCKNVPKTDTPIFWDVNTTRTETPRSILSTRVAPRLPQKRVTFAENISVTHEPCYGFDTDVGNETVAGYSTVQGPFASNWSCEKMEEEIFIGESEDVKRLRGESGTVPKRMPFKLNAFVYKRKKTLTINQSTGQIEANISTTESLERVIFTDRASSSNEINRNDSLNRNNSNNLSKPNDRQSTFQDSMQSLLGLNVNYNASNARKRDSCPIKPVRVESTERDNVEILVAKPVMARIESSNIPETPRMRRNEDIKNICSGRVFRDKTLPINIAKVDDKKINEKNVIARKIDEESVVSSRAGISTPVNRGLNLTNPNQVDDDNYDVQEVMNKFYPAENDSDEPPQMDGFDGDFNESFDNDFNGNIDGDFNRYFDGDFNPNFNADFNSNFNGDFNSNFNGDFNPNFNGDFNPNFNADFNENFNGDFGNNFNSNDYLSSPRNDLIDSSVPIDESNRSSSTYMFDEMRVSPHDNERSDDAVLTSLFELNNLKADPFATDDARRVDEFRRVERLSVDDCEFDVNF